MIVFHQTDDHSFVAPHGQLSANGIFVTNLFRSRFIYQVIHGVKTILSAEISSFDQLYTHCLYVIISNGVTAKQDQFGSILSGPAYARRGTAYFERIALCTGDVFDPRLLE